MLPLDDSKWGTLFGGYQVPYDPSDALQRLLDGDNAEEAIDELGNELCHQGDLGSASYASVPWLVQYLKQCPTLDARVCELILTIEFGRPFNKASVPDFLQESYERAIQELPEVVLSKRGGSWTDSQVQLAASVLALGRGNAWFARTYYELDRALLNEMIEKEFGSVTWDWP